jgi:hypothetical protein
MVGREIGPQHIGEPHFGIGRLPQQEVRQANFSPLVRTTRSRQAVSSSASIASGVSPLAAAAAAARAISCWLP